MSLKLSVSRPTLDVALGQVGLAVLIAACVALRPGLVLRANEGGISNFGVHATTVVFYSLALGLPAVFSALAARRLGDTHDRVHQLRTTLLCYSALITLTLVSTYPYRLDAALTDLHDALGIILTVFESLVSVWMCHVLGRFRLVLAAQLAGLLLGGLTMIGVLHLLFVSEMISGFAYACLLVLTTQRLTG